jgi:ubiquinone/menaquinone biosynthesis C-methylase UbiE
MKLNVGCGTDIREGFTNIDSRAGPGVNLIVDVTKGLPFDSDSVDQIVCNHTLEHIVQWERVVEEFYRVLKNGGILEIRVPRAPNYTAGHVRQFNTSTLDMFIIGATFAKDRSLEPRRLFKLISRKVNRTLSWHLAKYLHFNGRILRREIEWILEAVK